MKTLFKAVASVTLFTVIDRILGFLFKIYLSRELGAVQMGVYQVALSIFYLLLTATTSGIPLVVSKSTAAYIATGDERRAHAAATAAVVTGLGSAALVCIVTVLFRKPLTRVMASEQSMIVLLWMLPGVLCSGIYAALRGNLWGRQMYTANSVIEVIEQCARIALTVLLFSLGFRRLRATALGMSFSCAVTALCCIVCYIRRRGKIVSPRGEIAPLLRSSVPITAVRASGNVVNSLVAIVVPMLLVGMGHSNEQALYIFGSSIGMAMPLLYIPITVVGSLAYVMIPTLSRAYATGNRASAKRQIETAVTFSVVVAALFVPAFWALGEPIGKLVYDNADAGRFLSHSAWLLIPVSMENIASSMLNSLDLEKRGFVHYAIGSCVLFALLGIFCKSFTIDVLAVGLGASLTVSVTLDLIAIRKRTDARFVFLRPLVYSALLILPATFLTRTIYELLSYAPRLLSIGVAAVVGFLFMVLLGGVFGILDFGILRAGSRRKRLPTDPDASQKKKREKHPRNRLQKNNL